MQCRSRISTKKGYNVLTLRGNYLTYGKRSESLKKINSFSISKTLVNSAHNFITEVMGKHSEAIFGENELS